MRLLLLPELDTLLPSDHLLSVCLPAFLPCLSVRLSQSSHKNKLKSNMASGSS